MVRRADRSREEIRRCEGNRQRERKEANRQPAPRDRLGLALDVDVRISIATAYTREISRSSTPSSISCRERCRTNGAPSLGLAPTRACITRERSYLRDALSLCRLSFSSCRATISLPPFLAPSFFLSPSEIHARTCDPPRAMVQRELRHGEYYYCDSRNNVATPRGECREVRRRRRRRRMRSRAGEGGEEERSIRYRATHLDISPGLAFAMHDSYLANQFRPASTHACARGSSREIRKPISFSVSVSLFPHLHLSVSVAPWTIGACSPSASR